MGNTATASITVSSGVALVFDAPGATRNIASAVDVITVTANGSGAGFTTVVVNNNTASTFVLLPTIVTTATTIDITAPNAVPAFGAGDQFYAITVTDTGNGNVGVLSYVFQQAAA